MMNATTSPTNSPLKPRIIALFSGLLFANLLVWLWALMTFHDTPVLLGTCALAYVLGFAMRLIPITSRPSTMSPGNSCKKEKASYRRPFLRPWSFNFDLRCRVVDRAHRTFIR